MTTTSLSKAKLIIEAAPSLKNRRKGEGGGVDVAPKVSTKFTMHDPT